MADDGATAWLVVAISSAHFSSGHRNLFADVWPRGVPLLPFFFNAENIRTNTLNSFIRNVLKDS